MEWGRASGEGNVAAGIFEGGISVLGEARLLRSGAVGIWDSTVIAISSTAPAYSLAASMAAMVIAVGFTSPLVVALAFLPVMGIAVAFLYMNRVRQDCGTTFLWVGEALHPAAGFISGWASLAAGVLFMVSASSLAGSYSLNLLGQLGWIAAARMQDQTLVAVIGSLWFALVTFMVVYGITAAARFQRVLLALEYVIVLVFALIGLGKAYSHQPLRGSRHIDASWFSSTHIGGLSSFAAGAVIAVFFFWGWDTAANINEESENAAQNPGRAGVYSMFALLGLFMLGLSTWNVINTIQSSGSGWDTEKPVLYSLALGIPALAFAWYRNPQFFRRPVSAYDPASELV